MSRRTGGVSAAGFVVVALAGAQAETFHTAYMFTGGRDGEQPHDVVQDATGNLYGTTYKGGTEACDCGTIFKIAPDGTKTTLYMFKGRKDGAYPITGVTLDEAGNLYGTTSRSAKGNRGAVFKLDPSGKLTTLHIFKSSPDGDGPAGAPILGKDGSLYGTTSRGGHLSRGTVYRIAPDGKEAVLHSFEGTTRDGDGDNPTGALIAGPAGTLYGTTFGGGSNVCGDWGCCATPGCGTVFRITPEGAFTILYRFQGNPDGKFPVSPLARDRAGNLYGVTQQGGASNAGTIFKLAPEGTKSILYSFHPPTGSVPNDGPIIDRRGSLYGAAMGGSAFGGVVYKLTAGGHYRVLHDFSGGADGKYPTGSLLRGANGDLFGATTFGGDPNCVSSNVGCGTVFRIDR